MCFQHGRRFNKIVKGVEEEEYIIVSGRENCPERIGPEGETARLKGSFGTGWWKVAFEPDG